MTYSDADFRRRLLSALGHAASSPATVRSVAAIRRDTERDGRTPPVARRRRPR